MDGVLKWRKTRWGHYALLPVHDEILTWVPEHEAAEAGQMLADCMETTILSSPGFDVQITADVDKPFSFWQDSS